MNKRRKESIKNISKKSFSMFLAALMMGSTCTANVMAAPSSSSQNTEQGSSVIEGIESVLHKAKKVITGDTTIDKDRHATAGTFNSKRLIVSADKLRNIDKKKVIASYNGYYLLKYSSAGAAQKAYQKYQKKNRGNSVIAADQPVHMAAGAADSGGLTGVSKKANPLNELKSEVKDITKKEVKAAKSTRTIALLDTGASRSKNVIESVSMIGNSGADDNGHGEKMVDAITKQNSKARIISVKVLNSRGEGSVSSIVAGIRYAEKRGASIINLSLSGRAVSGNSIVTSAVSEAIQKGITVVGAAGNNGADAKNYIPGGINNAIIVGACDSNGNKIESSNYGETVDYNIVADSTSEASAKMSGYLSLHTNKDGSYQIDTTSGLIYVPGYSSSDDTIGKSSVSLAYVDEVPDTQVKLYRGGKNIGSLGKKYSKYSQESKTDSIKVTTEDYATAVTYPSGETQYYTDNRYVINLNLESMKSGSYTISSAKTKKDMDSIKKMDSSVKVYKNPYTIEAMQGRNVKKIGFQAQDDGLPDKLTGTIRVSTRNQSPFPCVGVNITNLPSNATVTHASLAYCQDHGAAAPNGTQNYVICTHEKDDRPRPQPGQRNPYGAICASFRKKYTSGGWTWYTVITHNPAQPNSHGSGRGDGYQRLTLRIGVKLPAPKTERTVKKVWEDHDKDSVKMSLKRYKSGSSNGTVKTITLPYNGSWSYTETGLPTEDSNGKKLTYKWVETSTFKGVTKHTDTSGTTDTITNTGDTTPEPTPGGFPWSISKVWLRKSYPNVEISARMDYNKKMYNLNKDGSRGSLKSDTTEHLYKTLNAANKWKQSGTIPISNVNEEEISGANWYENGWRYVGETTWRTDLTSIPGWQPASAAGGPYPGSRQGLLNIPAPKTTMDVYKEWNGVEAADSITMHLYGDTPEGQIDFGTTVLTKENGWHNSISDLPVYYTRTNNVLDYHMPAKYVAGEGFQVDEETCEQYRVKYKWVEEVDKTSYAGHNVSKLIQSNTCEVDDEPSEDDDDGGSGTAVNTVVNPTLKSYAVDATTGIKAGHISIDSDGTKYMSLSETVDIWDVAPGQEYTLISGATNSDGTAAGNDYQETTFIPEQTSGFEYTSDNGTHVRLTIPLNLMCTDGFDPTGKTITVNETLVDSNGTPVASENNTADADQTVYYPDIRTHMMSVSPSSKYGHTMDGLVGDTDGNHFGTLQNSPNGTISMRDTVTYTNLLRGYRYTVTGVLHRRGRTVSPGQDLGPVTVDGQQVTAQATFDVPGGDGPTASGTADVTYTFRFPENLYGGDYVSFENLRYNGIDLAVHSDISDGKQTVRMPVSFRIFKKDADTQKPIAGVSYQLFTKDGSGNLNAYKRDDGSDYIVTTDSNGAVEFRDLDIGTYWIKEIKVPKGYSLQADPFAVDAVESRVNSKNNENITTVELTTGGNGTFIFYVLSMLIAGSALLLVQKKKKMKRNS